MPWLGSHKHRHRLITKFVHGSARISLHLVAIKQVHHKIMWFCSGRERSRPGSQITCQPDTSAPALEILCRLRQLRTQTRKIVPIANLGPSPEIAVDLSGSAPLGLLDSRSAHEISQHEGSGARVNASKITASTSTTARTTHAAWETINRGRSGLCSHGNIRQ